MSRASRWTTPPVDTPAPSPAIETLPSIEGAAEHILDHLPCEWPVSLGINALIRVLAHMTINGMDHKPDRSRAAKIVLANLEAQMTAHILADR